MLSLTSRQWALVRRVRVRLLQQIERAGLSIERRSIHAYGQYDEKSRKILLARKRPGFSVIPAELDELFTLGHEFGHHLAHGRHQRRKRRLDLDLAPDVLYDEDCAWIEASIALHKHGLRGRAIWAAFHVAASTSLTTSVWDFSRSWWLAEHLKRLKIRCPRCRSRALSVLGLESRRDCALQCRACGTHTKPRRTMRALSKAVRGTRFTGICHCNDAPKRKRRSSRQLCPDVVHRV